MALASGDEIAALRASPEDAFVLDRLGMHVAAAQAYVPPVDFLGLHGRAVSLAKLGNVDAAKTLAAAARMRWSRRQRKRFALAIAPWAPDEAAHLLKPIHPLAAAAAALAAGDLQLARKLMPHEAPPGETLQFPAVAAALASHAGDWRNARSLLDRVLALGQLAPLASGGEGPLTLGSLPAAVVEGAGAGPAVTVLMPVRNLEDHIAMAIASLRAQTLADWELIIVDDASTDRTAALAEAAAAGDRRIRVLRNSRQLGAFGSRNVALARARGRYVTVLDGDDFAHPQRLETHVRILDAGRHRAVASLLLRIDMEGRVVAPRVFPMARRNYSSLMIGADLARELGGYDAVPMGGDSAMFWRVQAKIGRKALLRLDQADTFALQRDASLTSAAETGIGNRDALAQRIAYHERIMRELAGLES